MGNKQPKCNLTQNVALSFSSPLGNPKREMKPGWMNWSEKHLSFCHRLGCFYLEPNQMVINFTKHNISHFQRRWNRLPQTGRLHSGECISQTHVGRETHIEQPKSLTANQITMRQFLSSMNLVGCPIQPRSWCNNWTGAVATLVDWTGVAWITALGD